MGKNYVESSLKRFLKRKAKITLSFITAFMITGSVGFALTVTEDNITNSAWTNKNTIEEQIELDDKIADSNIDIFNKGSITTNEKITDDNASNLGNGLEIEAEKINLKDIVNTGKINTNVDINAECTSAAFGNGIYFHAFNDEKIENIINSGEIVTNTNGNIDSDGVTGIGNGIGIESGNLELKSFSNTGKIIANTGANIYYYSMMIGNGILFSSVDDNIKIGNIINSGEISGISSENIFTGMGIGNGIFAGSDAEMLLNKIENTGLTAGSVNNINNAWSDMVGNGLLLYSGLLEGDYDNLCEITNSGIIAGKINNILSEEADPGVRYGGSGINILWTFDSNIENTGLIRGNINKYEKVVDDELIELKAIASGGNGVEISSIIELYDILKGRNGDSNIIQDSLTNSGIITGNINEYKENIQGTNIGNGVGYFYQNNPENTVFNIKLSNIVNNGLISGNAGDILNARYINILNSTGNGVGISAYSGMYNKEYVFPDEKNTFKGLLDNFNNTGKISGNVNQTGGLYSNAGNGLGIDLITNNPAKKFGEFILNNLNNSGILSGNINNFDTTNEIEHISVPHTLNLFGNGLGINIYAGMQQQSSLTVGEIKNTGKISGNIKQMTGDNQSVNTIGNGIGITNSYYTPQYLEYIIPTVNKIDNTGIILGKEHGIYLAGYSLEENGVEVIEVEKLEGILENYSNGGIIAGKIPVYAQDFTDNMVKSADKGIAVKLDDNGNIESIINGTGGELNGKTVINADITDKDSFISVDKETSYADNIINGAGINSGTLNINAETNIKNSIVNALGTAVNINGNNKFTASNTVLNGGGLDGNTAVITDKGNSDISLNKSIINGNIVLGNGNSSLTLSDSQLNGNISGGDGKDNLVIGGLNIFHNIDGFENITFKGSTTLYETSKTAGADKIEIDSGAEVNLRIDSSKKSEDGTYKKHALFNSGNKQLILSGNTNAVTENDVDENGQFIVEENIDKINYNKVSILNIITNGLGINAKIDLGNTKVEDNLWVKTDSILNQAVKSENENGTILTVEAEKDLFTIIKKFENPNPGTPLIPLEPSKPINPGTPLIPLEPSKPVKPETPDMPNKYEKLYVKLNEVYKGIHTSNDRNFNALNDIIINYTFGDKDKTDYPAVGNEKMQMAALLGYLRSVYAETPYSFSNESTRKSMELFHDTARDNNFKAEKDKWLIYGGLVHQNGDQEQTYYGRNYHGFDTGTADTDAEIKLTGAYGQFEYGNTDTLSTGIIIGGTKSDVEVSSSDLKGTGAYAGIYAKKDIKNLRITAGAGYQYTEYESGRKTINETYSEDYKDKAFNLYLDGKYSYDLGNNLYFVPKAGLFYTHIDQDSIKENNDKALALNIDSKDFNVLEGTAGADIKKIIPSEKGKHSISAGVSYRYIFDGADADYLTADFGGNDFEILVPHKNKGQMSIGVRYEAELENGMFYDVKGNYFMNTDSKENTNKNADRGEWRAGAGIGYKF